MERTGKPTICGTAREKTGTHKVTGRWSGFCSIMQKKFKYKIYDPHFTNTRLVCTRCVCVGMFARQLPNMKRLFGIVVYRSSSKVKVASHGHGCEKITAGKNSVPELRWPSPCYSLSYAEFLVPEWSVRPRVRAFPVLANVVVVNPALRMWRHAVTSTTPGLDC